MKNLSMKVMYVCGKAVSEKAHVDQLLKERLDAGIARKSASDTLEIVLPAEFDRIGNCIFPIPETPWWLHSQPWSRTPALDQVLQCPCRTSTPLRWYPAR